MSMGENLLEARPVSKDKRIDILLDSKGESLDEKDMLFVEFLAK